MNFELGDEVVCIRNDNSSDNLHYGKVYTIIKMSDRHVRLQEVGGSWLKIRFERSNSQHIESHNLQEETGICF